MSYYLAIHEAPCVGVAPVAFEADTDEQAEDIAFEQSMDCREFATGCYDLYRIVYNPHHASARTVRSCPRRGTVHRCPCLTPS